jgi:aminoglycoside 6'-N-acetyltransferase I
MARVSGGAIHPGQLELRAAGPGDLTMLVELARAFYDEDGFSTTNDELAANFRTLLTAADSHVVIATVAENVCGFALTTTAFILESGLVAELQDLYVDPTLRGRGVATALIEDAAEWARAQSATLLEVVVAPNGRDVSSLLDFYTRRRFTDEGRRILSRRL